MSKKINDNDLDNNDIIGDSGDDLSDVKQRLQQLKKESNDSDEEEVEIFEDTESENEVAEDIVINEENSLPFANEDKYYKSLEKFLKENPTE